MNSVLTQSEETAAAEESTSARTAATPSNGGGAALWCAAVWYAIFACLAFVLLFEGPFYRTLIDSTHTITH